MANSLLDRLEKISKIVSLLAIPVVIAVGSWHIQALQDKNTVGQEYIRLAVSILASPRSTETDPLRPWAVNMLNRYAPVPLTDEQARKLSSGEIRLSAEVMRQFEETNKRLLKELPIVP